MDSDLDVAIHFSFALSACEINCLMEMNFLQEISLIISTMQESGDKFGTFGRPKTAIDRYNSTTERDFP